MQNGFHDRFGPEKVLEVSNPKVGLRGFLVIDNTALGPAKGGIRMTPSVSISEVARLARAMTWKCALAELPFGGGKSGIIADDRAISPKQKQELVKAFAEALREYIPKKYVAAPDINTAEPEMATFAKAIGSPKACTGKPTRMGGIPHEFGSTGFGVFHATRAALERLDIPLEKATVAIEGFGNVGWFAAKYLTESGAKLVAVSDSRGCLVEKKGVNFKRLAKVKKEQGSVIKYAAKKPLPSSDIVGVDADVLVTAAIPDLVKMGDVEKIRAKLIVEGSNIPMTAEVEAALHRRRIMVVPDFVANAGGVISSYVEYIRGSKQKMFHLVEKKVYKNTCLVLDRSLKAKAPPRDVALQIAQERVLKKCESCLR